MSDASGITPSAAGNEGLRLARRKSLPEQVADTIVAAIGSGLLGSGERIREAEIAARFEVSRVPVREAFRMLEAQGILEGQPNRGVRVAALDEATIDQICEARLAIEAMAARQVVARAAADPAVAAAAAQALDRRIEALAGQVRLDSPAGINLADVAFHRELCALSANRILQTLWEAIARHVVIVFGREILAEWSYADLVPQHRALAEAVLAGDETRAIAELERHVMRLRRRQAPPR